MFLLISVSYFLNLQSLKKEIDCSEDDNSNSRHLQPRSASASGILGGELDYRTSHESVSPHLCFTPFVHFKTLSFELFLSLSIIKEYISILYIKIYTFKTNFAISCLFFNITKNIYKIYLKL